MPSNPPRRPASQTRRPRVAGIRTPSASPRPGTRPAQPEEAAETRAAESAAATETAPRPSARQRARRNGTALPTDLAAAESSTTESSAAEPRVAGSPVAEEDRPARARWRPKAGWPVASALLGLAVLLACLAVWFKVEGDEVGAVTANAAVVDPGRTTQVQQATKDAVRTLFSYDYRDVRKTRNAARDLLLDEDARAKYDRLMANVERLAPQQKIVVTVQASRTAVIRLEDGRARVMAFVEQSATRTDANRTSRGSAQLWLQLRHTQGKWKVADLDTYQATAPPSPSRPAR